MCDNECETMFMDATGLNVQEIVNYLCDHGVLKSQINCHRCGNIVQLNANDLHYHCQKMVTARKQKGKRCHTRVSAKPESFLERTHLDVKQVWRLCTVLLHLKPPRQTFLREELRLTNRSIVDWYSFCREVFIDDALKANKKIGGHGKIIEIDEAKFGKSKYCRGRYLKGQWVFGGIERGTNNTFLVPVEKRDAKTLIGILEQWVLPNSIVMSDCWKAYDSISDKTMFYHFTVNHSVNFVDPDTGAHTNSIERTWRDVRSTVPRYGVRKTHFIGYLAEYQFKRRYDRGTRLHHFFKAAAALYPPKPLSQ